MTKAPGSTPFHSALQRLNCRALGNQPFPRLIVCLLLGVLLFSGCLPTPKADPTATPSLAAPTIVMIDGTPQIFNGPINPTPTPNTTNPNPVQVTELSFTQVGSLLTVIGKLQNTRSDAILRDVQLEIIALDASGNRIAQAFTAIRYIFPRETTGLVQSFELEPGLEAGSAEILVNSGVTDTDLKYQQPLSVSMPAWYANSGSPIFTGWLTNTDPYTYTRVALHAVAYNQAGEIIGGGTGKADFVPSEDRIGVQISTSLTDQPARIEIYPWISAESASLKDGDWWNTLEVKDWNYVLTADHWVGGGADLTNKSDALLTQNYYIITVSDAEGKVCLVNQGYIDLIWPKESLHFSPGILRAPQESNPHRVDMVVVPGEFGQNSLTYNPLISSQAVFLGDLPETTARVSIVNNLNANISNALVYVLIRNASGQIVGGGSQYAGAVPSNGAVAVEVPVAVIGSLEDLTIQASVTIPANVTIGQ